MREIKFRGWNPSKNAMQTAGSLEFWFIVVAETGINPFAVEKDIVFMQYTGLKDRNGKEIYEGDIVTHDIKATGYTPEYTEEGREVIWESRTARFTFKGDETWGMIYKGYEVIGNIYENPELIKK